MYNSYLKLQEYMKDDLEKDKALKRGFRNKALSGFMRMINLQTNYQSYDNLLQCVRDGAFKKLGIDQMSEEDYFSKWMYEQAQVMENSTTNEFMAWKLRKRYLENKDIKDKIKRYKTQRGEMKAARDELIETVAEQKKIIKEQNVKLGSKPVRMALKFRTGVRLMLYGKR